MRAALGYDRSYTESEIREVIREGYYENSMEAEEILGVIGRYFPEVDMTRDLEEIVSDVLWA